MTTILSADGLLEIPEEFRKADALEAGQRCEIERLGQGEYRVHINSAALTEQRGLVDLLESCPVKGFNVPLDRIETTDDLRPMTFE